jgi:dihydroflavonol-4-reductase
MLDTSIHGGHEIPLAGDDWPAAGGGPISVVTGGCGFIGQHLVRLLLDRGHAVRIIDRYACPDYDRRATLYHGSILDAQLVGAALDGADYLFHLAANPNLWAADKGTFHTTNYTGTCTVFDAAARSRLRRIVYCSTESILKGVRNGYPGLANESVRRTVADMPGDYCRSKFLAEREAMMAADRGLPVVIVNPTLPIGPGDRRLTPPTRMLLDFLNGDNPAYLDFEMNMIDVRDVAAGHLLAAERGKIGERYILGGENLRLSQVLDMLEDLSGLRMPRLRVPYLVALAVAFCSELVADHLTHRQPKASLAGVRLAGTSMTFDCTRAQRELGLRPRPVRSSLAAAIAWLQREGRLHQSLQREPLEGLRAAEAGVSV